jgi:hypothetical protein
MPKAVGEDALNGIKEHIEGFHTFTVTDQSKVKATGLLVGITRAGESSEEKTEKSTGAEGWNVSRNDKVRIYNADIVFE